MVVPRPLNVLSFYGAATVVGVIVGMLAYGLLFDPPATVAPAPATAPAPRKRPAVCEPPARSYALWDAFPLCPPTR